MHLAAGLAKDPGAERDDEAYLLADFDEGPGCQQPTFGMMPPHQGLEAHDLARLHLHRGLVVGLELILVEGRPQLRT